MLNEKQIENRKKGVGASEAGIVMNLDPNISPYQLWRVKTGRDEAQDLSSIPQVIWGSIHEPAIADYYAMVTNQKVRRVNETLFHVEHPFMLCHLDRKIVGLPKCLECKFAMYARDVWGPTGSDVVPMRYIIQVQYQMAVTGYEEADLAALISGWDFRIYNFKRDEEIIKKIIEEVSKFWKCVETDTPPPLRDKDDVAIHYPLGNGDLKNADPQIIKVIEDYQAVRSHKKEVDEKLDKLKDSLTLFIKEADGIKKDNAVLATWKANARGTRVLNVLEAR